MNRYQCIFILSSIGLSGCNPFGLREQQTTDFITQAEVRAKSSTKNYELDIRTVKPYKVYQYGAELQDPFRVREFLIKEEEKKAQASNKENRPPNCIPPKCVPPVPHEKQLLESYGLTSLKFVGTLGDNSSALIKTPDYGVLTVNVGDYLGKNNGRIQAINETSIVLQEKIHKNGLWENKKTILMIAR